MGKLFKSLAVGCMVTVGAASALAQKTNEIHVPIGQSPGLSGKVTLIARVQAVSAGERSLTLSSSEGAAQRVNTNAQTMIWLDRNKLKLSNRKAEFAELRTGALVEVKFRGNDRAAALAEWIKIEAAP